MKLLFLMCFAVAAHASEPAFTLVLGGTNSKQIKVCENTLTQRQLMRAVGSIEERVVFEDGLLESAHKMGGFLVAVRDQWRKTNESQLSPDSKENMVVERLQNYFGQTVSRDWVPELVQLYSNEAYYSSKGILEGVGFSSLTKFEKFVKTGGVELFSDLKLSRLSIDFANWNPREQADEAEFTMRLESALRLLAVHIKHLHIRGVFFNMQMLFETFVQMPMPLETLDLSTNVDVEDDVVATIARSKFPLTDLNLEHTQISDESARYLRTADFVLKHLNVASNRITDNFFKTLFSNKVKPSQHQFESIDVRGTAVTNRFVNLVLKKQPRLSRLMLSDTAVSWQGITALSRSHLPLKELSVGGSSPEDLEMAPVVITPPLVKELFVGRLPLERLTIQQLQLDQDFYRMVELSQKPLRFLSVDVLETSPDRFSRVKAKSLFKKRSDLFEIHVSDSNGYEVYTR